MNTYPLPSERSRSRRTLVSAGRGGVFDPHDQKGTPPTYGEGHGGYYRPLAQPLSSLVSVPHPLEKLTLAIVLADAPNASTPEVYAKGRDGMGEDFLEPATKHAHSGNLITAIIIGVNRFHGITLPPMSFESSLHCPSQAISSFSVLNRYTAPPLVA